MENRYLPLYFTFLRGEIPAALQILTPPTILVVLLSNRPLDLALLILAGVLLYSYLERKASLHLIEQVKNQFSPVNVEKLNDEELVKRWKGYILLTAFLLTATLAVLTYDLPPRLF